jgi:competence protein ComEC
VALALWLRRNVAAATVLAFALLAVLLLDPWAVLSAGFWLSFGCVAMLFFAAAGRLERPHWLGEWLRAQWAVTVGMIPAVLALFQQFSLVSPLANALAIPTVSLVVTPLALAACLLPVPLQSWLLWLAHGLTALLMAWVEWLAALPWAVWQQQAPPDWAVATGLAGVLWLLLPRGVPARWIGLLLLAPLLLVAPPRPDPGNVNVVVLDVGQGLAVHVQTAAHDLLYDAGPAFSPDANSGNRIILPYLRAVGVRRLDAFVITHQDKDHSGGAASVLDGLPVNELISSLPFEHELSAAPVRQRDCRDGMRWEWEGVRFAMLYPPAEQYQARPAKTNDMSCVLKISAAGRSLLLTSDIEAWSEQRLLADHPGELPSDVLLVPHHGSRTSSTAEFIAAVAAPQVIFPVGYRNRFNHPRADVVERYRGSGATLWRTDRDGALTVRLAAGTVSIAAERRLRPRYWHQR